MLATSPVERSDIELRSWDQPMTSYRQSIFYTHLLWYKVKYTGLPTPVHAPQLQANGGLR